MTRALVLVVLFGVGCSSGSSLDGTGGSLDGSGGDATGGAAPSGGSGGSPASGGAATGGSSAGGSSTGGNPDDGYPALEECEGASLDRIQKWWGTGEGPTIPGADSSLLVEDAGRFVARVEFASAPEWHVAPVWIDNQFVGVDVSGSTELRIEYSATSSFYVQLRAEDTFSGGAKWHHLLPATEGAFRTETISLTDPTAWTERLGPPTIDVPTTLSDLLALVFVGNTNNVIEIRSLRIRDFTPNCRP